MYGKKAVVDTDKQQKMLENEANRPYRLSGNVKIPLVGGVSAN